MFDRLTSLALLVLGGCMGSASMDGADGSDDGSMGDGLMDDTDDTDVMGDTGDTDVMVACEYPDGAVEEMAFGEVLKAYSWPTAIHRDGRTGSVDLERVPCADDEDIDWSPFDVLLFVSIPAW